MATEAATRSLLQKKIGVLKNFTKFTGKYLCQSPFFNKVASLRAATSTLLKKRLWHWCFLVNFAKLLRTPFLQNTSRRLLLWLVQTDRNPLNYQYFSEIFTIFFADLRKIRVVHNLKMQVSQGTVTEDN